MSRMELDDTPETQESFLDEYVDGLNTTADEEMEESILDREIDVEAPSDAQSDTQADSRTRRKRSRCSRNQRNGSDDENDEEKGDIDNDHRAMLSSADRKIQVGDDFQAQVDETQKIEQEAEMSEEDVREQVMWRPPANLDEGELLGFCEDAIGVYRMTYDRALYILQKCNFDFNLARDKVKRRRIVSEEWNEDDRTLFKQAFHMFGKRFDKIRQTMPYRSMASLIQFYYNTKKDIDYKSLYDSRMVDDSDDDK
ncbi:Myb-like DNA-binding domain protein [Dictyocaulus viviparus]|uniref:Myb-like DNA-binding domain protein n=1 Tax=Dictyocaulus viviparus TaxID=29172 RepID=A0A0D8X8H4_DICVI|nr:Myb-like DNA-binding domain protein [Dictyocaulus viviparus]